MIAYLLLTCLFCVGASMVCSLFEATLLSLDTVRLETLKREGKKYASVWIQLKADINKPIAAILIFNTVANTGGATLAGFLFDRAFGPQYLWLFMLGLTLAILFVSEIGPKFLGAVYAEFLAPFLGRPLYVLTKVSAPAIKVTDLVGNVFGRKGQRQEYSAMDIEVMAQLARAGQHIGSEQEKIIVNAAKLTHMTVEDAMMPANSILFLNLENPVDQNFRTARRAMHTRYPISSSASVNDIHGYVNFKDLAAIELEDEQHDVDLRSLMRPLLALDPKMNLNQAFRELTVRRYHIAIVRDRYKNVVGLLSLEDLLEELVGEIEDEFDVTSDMLMPLGHHRWRVGGAMPMTKLSSIISDVWGRDLPEQTVAQWMRERQAESQQPGMSVVEDGVEFTVRQARKGRIFQVTVEITDSGNDFTTEDTEITELERE
ncbi:MAG: CNNM domain-containing protein [Verrucomicrobiota bacterium]